jgi:hypothetical protein
MRYSPKTYKENFANANGSSDKSMMQDMVFDGIAYVIENHRDKVIQLLNKNGYKVSNKISQKKLIDKVIHASFRNKRFLHELNILIISVYTNQTYSYSDTSPTPSAWGGVANAFTSVLTGFFDYKTSKNEQQIAEDNAKANLYNKLIGNDGKSSMLPIIVIGSVLLIGGVIIFFALKKKNG